MAKFDRTNGKAEPMEQVGRDLFFKTFSGISSASAAAGQADLDALIQAIQQTSTVTVIGAFTAGTSTSVNVVIEGTDVTNGSNSPLTGITAADRAF